ncbi:MAG: hypothetical protein H7281_10625 [Bacteriovorax sp.]|nr:hypothetical protein [Bacteriovorax sp.]
MIKRHLILLVVLALASCARVQTLNLEKHDYSERPHHIIWFQIAGFTEEHIPLLRFNIPEANYRTSLEKIDCLGKMWNFNLYELRPDSTRSFLSQLNGSKNIKGQCEDFETRPVWDYLSEIGYASSLFDSGATDDQSLEKALKCPLNNTLNTTKLRYYRMGPDAAGSSSGKKSFHYQDSIVGIQETMRPGIYYDKSCQKNICYSSISNNFKTLWGQFVKDQPDTFFLVRDFNFIKGLKKKDIGYAKESLQEIERIVAWVNAQKRDDVLILITGAESQNIEFPKEGKQWAEFERSGKNILYRNSSLMSPVMAAGPMSENFCGLFDESEMLKRVLHHPEKKQFNWDLLNPFTNW